MRGKKLFQYLLLMAIIIHLWGCARFHPKQEGQITSSPPGAHLSLYENVTCKKTNLDIVTPANIYVQQGLWKMWLIASLASYEPEKWLIPKDGNINHHFNLEKDAVSLLVESIKKEVYEPIRREKEEYNVNFMKGAIDVIGKCDKMLNSPRMLASSVASEAETEYAKFKMDYPEFKSTWLNKGLQRLVNRVDTLCDMSDYDNRNAQLCIVEIKLLIEHIKLALEI